MSLQSPKEKASSVDLPALKGKVTSVNRRAGHGEITTEPGTEPVFFDYTAVSPFDDFPDVGDIVSFMPDDETSAKAKAVRRER